MKPKISSRSIQNRCAFRLADKPESIDFQDSSGKSFLAEPSDGGHSMEPITLHRQSTWKIKQVFQFPNDEAIFGLGQHQDGWMNLAGKKIHLQQQNMLVGIPVLMSSRGYGIFWDNPSITDVASGAAADKPGTIQWASEVGDAIDYYVLYGPDLDQSIADYRFLTGSAPMFGRWAWGFWQSKERYASQDELLWIVDQYRSRHIPIDGIIQDWQYWSPGPWGSHKLDPSRYYDPKGLLQKLHANNIHMLISVWAKFDPDGAKLSRIAKRRRTFSAHHPERVPQGRTEMVRPFQRQGPGNLLETDFKESLFRWNRRLVAGRDRAGTQRKMGRVPRLCHGRRARARGFSMPIP